MNEKELVYRFKIAALKRISEAGLTPGEVGAMIKQAVAKQAAFPTVSPGGILSGLSRAVLVAAALTGGVGLGAGYVGEKMFGTDEQDVDEARERKRIDALRRATIRMNAEARAARDTEDERKRRPQALEIFSAV